MVLIERRISLVYSIPICGMYQFAITHTASSQNTMSRTSEINKHKVMLPVCSLADMSVLYTLCASSNLNLVTFHHYTLFLKAYVFIEGWRDCTYVRISLHRGHL